ncbi:MAG: 4Fe-4S binding protein [archaeon]
MQKEFSNKIVWDKEKCKFCGICEQMCPKNCIKFNGNELEFNDECIKCQFCENYCPDLAIEVKK